MQDSDFLDVFDEVSAVLAKVNKDDVPSQELLAAVRKALDLISKMYDDYDEYITERDQEEEDDEVEEQEEEEEEDEEDDEDDDEEEEEPKHEHEESAWR